MTSNAPPPENSAIDTRAIYNTAIEWLSPFKDEKNETYKARVPNRFDARHALIDALLSANNNASILTEGYRRQFLNNETIRDTAMQFFIQALPPAPPGAFSDFCAALQASCHLFGEEAV